MNPKIQAWETELNQLTAQFKNTFGHLSSAELNYKLNPESWSIAENIDHLIRINESYYPVVKQVRQGNQNLPFISKFSFFTNLFGNMILKSVAPDRKNKIKTFPIWEPKTSNFSGNILDKFEKHHQEFIAFIKENEDLLQKNPVISSPANRMIVYPLATAFDIIVSHEMRHFNQAQEVLASIQ